MNGGTHADRILDLLSRKPGLDDDEIARALGIEPRQTVNQICRRLAASGTLRRERGSNGKIVNIVGETNPDLRPPAASPVRKETARINLPSECRIAQADLARTLLIIPCSGAKRARAEADSAGNKVTQSLPDDLTHEFLEARSRIRERSQFDERTLIPAWQRYDGALYQAGRRAIGDFMKAGTHVVILSGGYGVVLAGEPIGMYKAVLTPAWWPGRIIERVLLAYAVRHRVTSVRALVSATGPYVTVLRKVRWRESGIADALLLTPQAESGGMRKSPATQGEALAALYEGNLSDDWRSSYGLSLDIRDM